MDYPLIDDLTDFVCKTSFDDLPAEVVDESIRNILDSIGCALAGMSHPRGQIGARFGALQKGEEATILGTGERASMFGAAFANAEAINALDFDAILPPGHVAPYCFPAALAMGESLKSGGKDLILATALANEISNRIGKAMDYTRDVRDGKMSPPTVWGFSSTVFGSTAGVAKLKGLDRDKVHNAISIAGLSAPVNAAACWREHSPPTTLKYNLAGAITQAALTAAFMAEFGHRGDAQIFDPEFGYPKFSGTRRWEPANSVKDLGKVWNFPKEASFKFYPHCRVLAAPLDALIGLVREHALKPDEIEGIKAWVEGFLVRPLWLNRDITHVTDAQFSVAHGLALGAHDFTPGPDWQDPEKVYAPSVMSLMERTEHVVHPDYVKQLMGDADARPTRVEVRARGRTYVAERSHPRGTSRPGGPEYFTTPELIDKFMINARYMIAEEQARALADRIMNLATLKDVNQMTAIIRPGAKRAA